MHSTVKVLINDEVLNSAPECPHGPCVLFERETKNGSKIFYACSANRDRKLCNFYQLISEDGVPVKQRELSSVQLMDKNDNSSSFINLWKKFKKLPVKERKFCKNCGVPIGLQQDDGNHVNHTILEGVTDDIIMRPTFMLEPITENKGLAQFHFDDKTTSIFKVLVKQLKVTHVLCIGVPSLFEELQKVKIPTFLLDIDERLTRMLPSASRYNMFNHHFFESEGRAQYLKFLSSASKLLVIIDPPFGGMIDLILFCLTKVSKDYYGETYKGQTVHTLIALPYFLEDKFGKDGEFKMVDMEVNYKNHAKLKKRKRDGDEESMSIVRLFTNLPLSEVVLPSQFGYRYCDICQKYTSPQNKHCSKCMSCTTKVGKTYWHCEICKRCVKSNWQHCQECKTCELPGRHSKALKIE